MALIEVNWKPTRGQLQLFGVVGVAVLASAAVWVLLARRLPGLALSAEAAGVVWCALAAASAVLAVLVAFAPAGLRPLYWALTAVGLPIGFVMSYVLLGAVYFGLFTPLALVFRLLGRDVLCRTLDRKAASYWTTRKPTDDARRYFRQF